jgi:hypothetical protein
VIGGAFEQEPCWVLLVHSYDSFKSHCHDLVVHDISFHRVRTFKHQLQHLGVDQSRDRASSPLVVLYRVSPDRKVPFLPSQRWSA